MVLAACGSSNSGSDAQSRPAATVNGSAIPMGAFNKQVWVQRIQAARSASAIDPCSAGQNFAGLCQQLKQNALDVLIDQELVDQYAQRHHMTVSDADFNRQWAVIVKDRFHNDNAVLRAFARGQHLTVADLQTFERENLVRQAVLGQVTRNMPLRWPATRLSRILAGTERELKTVQTSLKAGRSFNYVARLMRGNLRSMCAQQACGDLGWLPNVFVPVTEQAAVTARPGTILGPLAGQTGYTLIQVEAHQNHYLLNVDQEIAMRERIFASWLAGQRSHATIHRYVA
jgi:hypothetical protein